MGRPKLTVHSSEEEAPSSEADCWDESDVLCPVSVGSNPDDWPCFVLNEALVLDKAGNVANLLHAEIEGPLLVRGQLRVDKELKHLRTIHNLKGAQVSVKDVKAFSMSDEQVTIWALGKSGWFEIRPAAEYRQTYKKMAEGVTLYYTLVDIYENNKQPKKAMELDQIVKQYSVQRGSLTSQSKFTKLCSEHALFLFSQMLKPNEPVAWTRTKLYKWLLETFSETHERYKNGIERGGKEKEISRAPATSQYSAQTPVKVSKVTISKILDTVKQIYTSGRHRREKLTLRQLSRALYEEFDFTSMILAQEFLRVNAKPLLAALRANWEGERWEKTPLYLNLQATLDNPGKDKDLRRNAMTLNLKSQIGRSSIPVSRIVKTGSGDIGSSGSRSVNHSSDHRGKLRKTKGKQISEDEELYGVPEYIPLEEEAKVSVSVKSTPKPRSRVAPRRSGKKAALRLVRSSVPETSSPVHLADEDGNEDGPSRKRRKVSPSSNDEFDSGNSNTPNVASDISEEDEADHDSVNIKLDFALETTPLISTSPQGSSGLWSCPRKRCNHTIIGANESEGKSDILSHLRQHADEIEAKENLILKEARPGLKVNHLLEKIRKMGEKARLAEQKEINGRVVPQPIHRHMTS